MASLVNGVGPTAPGTGGDHRQPPPGAAGRSGRRQVHFCQFPGALPGQARFAAAGGLARASPGMARKRAGRIAGDGFVTRFRPRPTGKPAWSSQPTPPVGFHCLSPGCPEPGGCDCSDRQAARAGQNAGAIGRAGRGAYSCAARLCAGCSTGFHSPLSGQPLSGNLPDPLLPAAATAKEPDLRLADLPAFQLAPFDEPKIDRYITGWYAELVRLGTVAAEAAPALTGKLQVAVRRPDLWRLAPNPLLLTVMALVHTHKGRLPEARALLYEETVDILLWRWEQMKLTHADDAPQLRQLLLEAGRGDVDLKRSLWELAYEAHGQSRPHTRAEGLADISQYRLQSALAALKDDDHTWARQVIETMKLRAGLLLERAPEVFTFPHRTFQEYLAGAHLAAQGDFAVRAADLSRQGALWREAILLGSGKLVHHSGEMDKPLALVGELCPAHAAGDDTAWRQAWLAGDVLLEIGLARVGDSALGCDLLERVRERLVTLIKRGRLVAGERARAGDTLARLGDPRFDPAHWYLPAEHLLGFMPIPAGRFRMGSDPRRDKSADDDEKPQHEVHLPDYYIARYPVTVTQFRAFIEARKKPPQDMDSLGGLPNHPVVLVTWYEAQEYCGWLGEQLRSMAQEHIASGLEGMDTLECDFWRGVAQGRLTTSLPSEAQWEKAARGEAGWIYPWGTTLMPRRPIPMRLAFSAPRRPAASQAALACMACWT